MAIADKVKKAIRSRAFLFKLIVSILVLICIPMLIMQIVVISESTDEFRRNNQEYYCSLLQSSAQTFVSREQVLSQTALRISMNEAIQKPLRPTATEYSVLEAANALSSYGAEILHMENVGVYYVSKGYLLTGGIKYDLQSYCEKMEPADEAEAQKLSEFLCGAEKTMNYYITSDGSTLYAARAISLVTVGKNDAVAFFAMDAATLEESYRAAIDMHASLAVLNNQGEFLLKGEDFANHINAGALNTFLHSSNSSATMGQDNELMLYRYTDPDTEFVFLLSLDKDEAQEQLLDFADRVRITTWVIAFVVTLSLLVTIYINYKPINKLLKKYASAENRDMSSEIERLDSTLFKLDKEMSTQKNLLTEFILGDLIFGKAVKPELLSQYFPADSYHSCVVFTVQCPTLTMVQSNVLTERLEEITGCDVHVTSVPSRPHAVIACLSGATINENILFGCVSQVVTEVLGVSCPVCMGEVVSDIHDLRASYRSAVMVNSEAAYAEPGANAGELTKKLQALSQCIYMGDETDALAKLEDIRKFLYTNIVGEGHLRYYGFKLLNAYLTSINSGKTQLSGREVELLLSYTSMDHLFKLLSESIHQVCGQVADMEHSMDLQMQQRLLQYVDDNFTRSELCLTAAADHIGTSIYAVSRLFKEITGKGFKDYVTEKRLEYGHRLLRTSTASISEISAAAGFENANYFSTIFKQKYGMPPTKYRNEHKDKLPEE